MLLLLLSPACLPLLFFLGARYSPPEEPHLSNCSGLKPSELSQRGLPPSILKHYRLLALSK